MELPRVQTVGLFPRTGNTMSLHPTIKIQVGTLIHHNLTDLPLFPLYPHTLGPKSEFWPTKTRVTVMLLCTGTLDLMSLLWLVITGTLLPLRTPTWGARQEVLMGRHQGHATALLQLLMVGPQSWLWPAILGVHHCRSAPCPKGCKLWLWPVITEEHCCCSAPQDTPNRNYRTEQYNE